MNEYKERFGEYLPLYELLGVPDEKIIRIAEDCMKTGEPYSGSKYERGLNY